MSLLKRETKFGIKKATTWGTGVEPSTNEGYFIESFSGPAGERNILFNDEDANRTIPNMAIVGNYPEVSGNFTSKFYYEGLETLIGAVFGLATSTLVGTSTYKHAFTFDDVIDDIIFTIAYDEVDEVKSIPSAVINEMKITIDEFMKVDFGFIGNKVSISGFSLAGLTYKSNGKGVFRLLDTEVYINDNDAADFTDSDKVECNNIEFTITRGYEALPVVSGDSGIVQPVEAKAPEVMLTLGFPKKSSQNSGFLSEFFNATAKKIKIVATGTEIETGQNYKFEIYLPKMVFSKAPDVDFETPKALSAELRMIKAESAPTGMSSTLPYMNLYNTISSTGL